MSRLTTRTFAPPAAPMAQLRQASTNGAPALSLRQASTDALDEMYEVVAGLVAKTNTRSALHQHNSRHVSEVFMTSGQFRQMHRDNPQQLVEKIVEAIEKYEHSDAQLNF